VVVATVTSPATKPGSVVPLGPPSLQTPVHEDEYDNYYDTPGGADADADANHDNDNLMIVAENWDLGFSSTRGGLYMLFTMFS